MFHEVAEGQAKSKQKRKVQCTNQIVKAFRDMSLRPGANITVMGVGGAGRNAIRNMRALGLDQFVKLVAVDTDAGCDIKRYGKKRKG
jgi:cell division GTPase FtsZ